MQNTNSIPPSAVAALNAGRKIEAIRIVREADGIGLEEARELVESYLALHPELQSQIQQRRTRGAQSVATWILLLAILAWFVVRYLSAR